jgi:uncharacterized protein (TIGR03435 family)
MLYSPVDALLRIWLCGTRGCWPVVALGSGRFDIVATAPPETTKEQFTLMLQNLLADRFHLVVHREAKEELGFSMVVAKNGPKLKDASDAGMEATGNPPAEPAFEAAMDAKGYQ